MHNKIPAVTHIDGSGRLQTVEKTTNPKFYNLIKEFFKNHISTNTHKYIF